MTMFNDLSLSKTGVYPSMKIFFENGNVLLIKEVQFYTVFEINGVERLRVWTSANKPQEFEGVSHIYNTNYDD